MVEFPQCEMILLLIAFSRPFFQVMWIYREISAPILFFRAQFEPNIKWRTKYFRLKWGGLVEPLDKQLFM